MLLELILDNKIKAVAVAGLAKNTGKTVTFNRLVAEAHKAGFKLGLTSIGRDGEKIDAVFKIKKPPVLVPRGSLVVVWDAFLAEKRKALNPLLTLGKQRFYGELLLARVEEEEEIELAGPITNKELLLVLQKFAWYGVDLTVVDGAIDRLTFAGLTDGLILATGAVLGASLQEIAEKTFFRVKVITLPPTNFADYPQQGYFNGRWQELPGQSLLGEMAVIKSLPQDTLALKINGALTDTLLNHLRRMGSFPEIIINSPAHFFASSGVFNAYLARGGKISVVNSLKLLAVTVNPQGINYSFSSEQLCEAVKNKLGDIPVLDVVKGIKC